jgi:PST family polysaccharide transporter
MVGRSLKTALVIAPLVITGYIVGLPHGPRGVAFAYSAVMTAWVIPHIAWCVHGTAVSMRDIFRTVARPLLSGLVAAALAFGVQLVSGHAFSPLIRLALGGTVLLGAYLAMLLYVMGEKSVYVDLQRSLKRHFSESAAKPRFQSGEA